MSARTGDSNERAPLLGEDDARRHDNGLPAPPTTLKRRSKTASGAAYVVAIVLAQIVALELSNSFIEPSLGELEEAAICRDYFANVDVPDPATDPRCKSEPVQSELSMLQGVEMTIALLPGLLTSVPYGIAAERYGRRIILMVCTFGLMLMYPLDLVVVRYLPVKFIWLVANTNYVGGGVHVMMALLYTIVSDVTTQAHRSTIFFYIAAARAGTALVGNPLAYLAMRKGGPWLTGCLSSGCLVVMFLLSFAVPETGHPRVLPGKDGPSRASLLSTPVAASSAETAAAAAAAAPSTLRGMAASIKPALRSNKTVAVLLCSTLFTKLGSWVSPLLMQFLSKRLSYSWAEASLALSVKAFSKLALVLVILPLVSQALIRAKVPPRRKDLLIARWCVVLAMAGAFGIAFASNAAVLLCFIVPFSLTEGFDASIKSLLAQVAGDGQVAVLFSVVSLLENLGIMVAGPGMAYAFRLGLRWGGAWFGLPFIVAGVIMAFAAAIVLSVRVEDMEHGNPDCQAVI
ncbi:hypothetical protein EsDP_00001489 [Epichloe bromicola]|uniref:Major facilitator superfamily transporter n=1 Tax=Epichloe bromicola TaxID=79588 RepID=A0ABQ0CHZ9_9HYPO